MYASIGSRTLYATLRNERAFSFARTKGELVLRLGHLEVWFGRRVRRAADPLILIEA